MTLKVLFSKSGLRANLVFDKATLRRDKDNNKSAKLRFALLLVGDAVLHCPAEIRAAYEACDTRENKISYIELDHAIQGVNIDFFGLPDSKSCTLALQSVTLDKLAIERSEQKGRAIPHLLFTVELALEDKSKLRYWIVDNVFGQLWATFEATQIAFAGMTDEQRAEACAEDLKRVN